MVSSNQLRERASRIQDGLDLLKSQGLDLPDVIDQLCILFRAVYRVSAVDINNGQCEEFAACIQEVMGSGRTVWGDELYGELSTDQYMIEDDTANFAWHCVYESEHKRYYDSEHPWGVDDFREMPIWYQ